MTDSLELWLASGQTVIHNSLLHHYATIGLDETELIFIIQMQSYLDQSVFFPNMAEIANRMGRREADIFSILHSLIQKNIISISTEKDDQGKVVDRYSLLPLYKKLQELLSRKKGQFEEKQQSINLLEIFQQEFGRLLTPIEMQTIGEWLDRDHYSQDIILEALREAVLNQKYSLKYIDRILLSWDKKNIRSSSQAKQETKRFAHSQYKEPTPTDDEEELIPLFNWLEE
ncbi:MAG TPA: DnaD domain-containing protein [Candidatus Jeotgalibaca merdavium]|uniref:DnaD domain-containing protein n=2 Tax=Jeotgalibaca TaxID=1470540 RepID=A0A6G7KC31_9LACT|nr:DnaD domain-containing protein [Jeotgalibaca arthritidis]QII82828.1 DnaD domain-containing protein [Jeotgalibaca arthritidis]HJA89261.1 DnaD domain-containing protein [Candidatus Jeotgalibaca merdavium]